MQQAPSGAAVGCRPVAGFTIHDTHRSIWGVVAASRQPTAAVFGPPLNVAAVDPASGVVLPQIDIALNEASRDYIRQWAPGKGAENYVISATIQAVKPRA